VRTVRRIGVRYDHTKKEHELTVSMSIPLFNDDRLGVAINRPESGTRRCHTGNHSTVTERFSLTSVTHQNGGTYDGSNLPADGDVSVVVDGSFSSRDVTVAQSCGVYVRFDLVIHSPACWVSNYNEYQVYLSDKIAGLRSDGWTYKQISDWFNEHDFRTPRDRVFSDRHVHSIHKKRQARDDRFLQEPVLVFDNVRVFFGAEHSDV
jgi:hypothetical protein